MLEKPEIPDGLIASCAHDEYRLDVAQVSFLPIGYDVNTAVYRVVDRIGTAYFLKLRKGDFNPIPAAIPHLLSSLGIHTIIAPIETHTGQLIGRLKDYSILLYPFIPGKDGYEVRLVDQHWVELGWTLNRVHAAKVPPSLTSLIPREAYDPQWRESVKHFQAQVEEITYDEPVANRLSAFMKTNRRVISQMVGRAEELAHTLSQQSLDLVLCHSDAHPGNYLMAGSGELYLVDWDNPIFAPKERDLMFFGSGMAGDQPGGWEETSFYQGYGPVNIDRSALAYYRYERIVQDIAEFCKQLLWSVKGSEDREQAYKYFTSSFLPGHVVEVAFETDRLANRTR
jgi:spectinomycin phosphotransferase